MKLHISQAGLRKLLATKEELHCKECKEVIVKDFYYCELGKCLICFSCMYHSKERFTCNRGSEHQDWKIDEVVEESGN